MKQINLDKTVELLSARDSFIILTHENPDGDTIGSAFALKKALKKIGKEAICLNEKPIPKKYGFLGKFDDLSLVNNDIDYCIVSVDVADKKLLGNNIEQIFGSRVFLSIDHHLSNRLFAEYSCVDSTSAATCELIFDIITLLDVAFDKEITDCLYTGISTDTGCFRYSNVTSKTLRISADLIDYGADNAEINRKMFETKTKTFAALERLALDSLTLYYEGKLAVIVITADMYVKTGSDESETDAIASLPRQIEGVEVGVMMRQKSDGTFKVSMRGNGMVDVSVICSELGGGGHKSAAGCTVSGSADEVKNVLFKVIEKYL